MRFLPKGALSFLSLTLWFLPRKTVKLTKDRLSLPNPQSPWKGPKNNTKVQSKLNGDAFSIEAPQNLLKKEYSENFSSGKEFPS